MSLKVLAELPIIVVLMYQLYKQHVHNDVAEFIPLIMNTIVLQPTPQQRSPACLLISLVYKINFCLKVFSCVSFTIISVTTKVFGFLTYLFQLLFKLVFDCTLLSLIL